MNTIILAFVAIAASTSDGWKVAVPYAEGITQKHDLQVKVDMGGQSLDVEMVMEHKTAKKTETGFEGTGGFPEVFVNGDPQEGMSMGVVLLPNGALKSVTSDMGADMRRMFMAFYFCYPTEAVGTDGKWSFTDAEATNGHKAKFEYTLDGKETVDGKELTKVKFALSEDGTDGMTATGSYWIGEKGQVAKFDLDLKRWPVPVTGGSVDAKVTGKAK